MRTALAIAVGVLIVLAMVASFFEPLGLDVLWPGLDTGKTAVVAVVFLAMAVGGLFHRINRSRRKPPSGQRPE